MEYNFEFLSTPKLRFYVDLPIFFICWDSYDFKQIKSNIDVNPKLTEEQALRFALKYIGAEIYKWQIVDEENWLKENFDESYFPKGELVIIKDFLNNTEE